MILQVSELYLTDVWKHSSSLRIHALLLNGCQLFFVAYTPHVVLNYRWLSLGANTLNITYNLEVV